jgi:hypothetical protein
MNCLKLAVLAAAVVASGSAMAIIPQFDSPETVNIYQQGVGNVAGVSQTDADGSSVSINQWGSLNNANVTQTMHNSTISLTENGYNNLANLSQTGTSSWASMTVKQSGALNSATVAQSDFGAVANVTQVGYHNTANVQQH